MTLKEGSQEGPVALLTFAFTPPVAIFAGYTLYGTLRMLRLQRTAQEVADDLALNVERVDGVQYRQLLGSGHEAPRGRINLSFSQTVTHQAGTRIERGLEDISEIYLQTRPIRVIITGLAGGHPSGAADAHQPGSQDAGTGKTVLALSLVLDLARNHKSTGLVPVWLPAPSWRGQEISIWIKDRLHDVYGLGRGDSELIVEAGLVLPVIDGLDELESGILPGYNGRAAALLRALQRFETGGELRPAVVTCRHDFYQALVDSGTSFRADAHITLNRISPELARRFLEHRVAATAVGRRRWGPVLKALQIAAGDPVQKAPGGAARAHSVASALETPWRLMLAVTVFEEQKGGLYLRDPAALITLAISGRLHRYLLDRYIDAAVAAPHHAREDIEVYRGRRGEPRLPRLDAATTWGQLAQIADYLNTNRRLQRKVWDRRLSGSEIVLHELWPLAGAGRVRWISRVLALLLVLVFGAVMVWLGTATHPWTVVVWVVAVAASFLNKAWPQAHRIEVRRLSPRTGGLRLLAGLGAGCLSSLLIGLVFGALGFLGGLTFELGGGLKGGFSAGLVFGLSGGIWVGVATGLTSWLLAPQSKPVTDPRALVRGDCITALVFGLAFGILTGLLVGFAVGPTAGLVVGTVVVPVIGFENEWGQVSIRYFAFLLCTRGKLPWRLGRFLDSCYRLDILRVAGAAWEFRHRELQDHLANWPSHPNRSQS
ncbi:hypothetical protein ACWCQ1_46025 [Streptomyces sp. NPDC002144]